MISPIQNNGVISLSQDVQIIKHSEDSKVDNSYIAAQSSVETRDDQVARTVISADSSPESDTHHDAREEGKNKYVDLRNKNKKKIEPTEGVIVKKPNGSFDLRI